MLRALRFVGLVAGGVVGWQLGLFFSLPQGSFDLVLTVLLTTIGAALGLVVMPLLTLYPLQRLRRQIEMTAPINLVAIGIGLVVGLVIAALLVLPLSLLPAPFNQFLPIVGAAFFGYLGVASALTRKHELLALFRRGTPDNTDAAPTPRAFLLDTSVVIDGRIADVSQTGFLDGELIVPRFVLEELQHVADSADVLRRNRGRRGLEVLNRLQKDQAVPVRIIEATISDGQAVDAALISLALQRGCPIVTNDYNLNRVAVLQGVRVLNLNELAQAVRPIVLPGEELTVQIVQEGKEAGQGVAYLDDGTMIVVDQGRRAVGSERRVTVTRVLQTVAGRLIFATLRDGESVAGTPRDQPRSRQQAG